MISIQEQTLYALLKKVAQQLQEQIQREKTASENGTISADKQTIKELRRQI